MILKRMLTCWWKAEERFLCWFRENRCRLGFHDWHVTGVGTASPVNETQDFYENLRCALCRKEEKRIHNPWSHNS